MIRQLDIDSGNTAVKCRFANEITTIYHQTSDFEEEFQAYLHVLGVVERVVWSNVSNQSISEKIKQCIRRLAPQELIVAKAEARYKTLKNGYKNYSELGVDRWFALIASQMIEGDKIIVDVGTWIKADYLLSNGEHLGGVIISHCQTDETQLIERFAIAPQRCSEQTVLLGSSTQECVCANYKHYGEQGLIHWLSQVVKHPIILIVTGGGGEQLSELRLFVQTQDVPIKHIHFQRNLVLSGLSIRYPS